METADPAEDGGGTCEGRPGQEWWRGLPCESKAAAGVRHAPAALTWAPAAPKLGGCGPSPRRRGAAARRRRPRSRLWCVREAESCPPSYSRAEGKGAGFRPGGTGWRPGPCVISSCLRRISCAELGRLPGSGPFWSEGRRPSAPGGLLLLRSPSEKSGPECVPGGQPHQGELRSGL